MVRNKMRNIRTSVVPVLGRDLDGKKKIPIQSGQHQVLKYSNIALLLSLANKLKRSVESKLKKRREKRRKETNKC